MYKPTLPVAALLFLCFATVRAQGEDRALPPLQPTRAAPLVISSKRVDPLCDQDWRYGFSTIAIEENKYDGTTPLEDYDPQNPDQPWSAVSDRYLRLHDRTGRHFYERFLGQFYDDKEAQAFLTKVHQEAKYARYLNPRYPPSVSHPGALLVSDHYTCTLDHSYPALRYADWIVEVDGNLYAGKAEGCKKGKRTKTITVVDCSGVKTLFTDTMTSPCEDASPTSACIYPMSPGYVAIKQEYSAAGDELNASIRVYDVANKKVVVKIKGGGALTGDGGSFRDLADQDGDGIPEVVDRDCVEGRGCVVKRLRKWNGTRFEDAKAK